MIVAKRVRSHEKRTLEIECECSIRPIQEMEGMLEMLKCSEHFRKRLREHRIRLALVLREPASR